MFKSMFLKCLWAFVPFSISVLLCMEVNAQMIEITSGDKQETTRGNKFANAVTFTVTNGVDGTGVENQTVAISTAPAATPSNHQISVDPTEDFSDSLSLSTDSNGQVSIYVKTNPGALFKKCYAVAAITVSIGETEETRTAYFTGTITDVLYFSADTATRSVNEGATAGTDIGNPVVATHWANADTDTTNDVELEYKLEGTDAAVFNILSSTGQLKVKDPLDYETKNNYSVKIVVEEKEGSTVRSFDTIDVTINVNDVDEPSPPPQILQQPSADTPQNVEINLGTSESLTVRRIDSRSVELCWNIPTTLNADTIMYQYSIDGGQTWTSTGSTDTCIIITEDGVGDLPLDQFKIRAMNQNADGTRSFVIISARPPEWIIQECPADGFGGRTQRMPLYEVKWDIPATLNADTITGYQYSIDGGQIWTSTGSTNTCLTITEDGVGDLPLDQFKIRAMNRNADGTHSFVIISARPQQRIIIQECPVGWQRTDSFAQPNRRVLLYEVKLKMDLQNLISIYKPDWVAIYVHPDEGLENLHGWKLQVAVPYNHHREYLLTADNSVVVDAGFVEGGFAFIENPEEDPFPMVGMGFTGATVPGFDYRLYDDQGRKIDFGIACYKRGGIFQALKDMEDPRVLRNVLLETLDWDSTIYIRSEWTVPAPAPAAPSLVKKTVVGTWAALKKQ